MFKKIIMGSLLFAGFSSEAQAQLVTNGGFEAPTVNSPCCITVPSDATPTIPGWTATPNVNVVNGTFSSTNGNLAIDGTQYLDLVGEGGQGSISQDIATVVGQWYTLSFIYSHNLFAGLQLASADVYVGDGPLPFATITHTGGDRNNLNWLSFSQAFQATNTTTTLRFVNTVGAGNEGVFLDAINVAAVPEPATWAMMLLGFGGIGMAMRRSRRNSGHQALAQIA